MSDNRKNYLIGSAKRNQLGRVGVPTGPVDILP